MSDKKKERIKSRYWREAWCNSTGSLDIAAIVEVTRTQTGNKLQPETEEERSKRINRYKLQGIYGIREQLSAYTATRLQPTKEEEILCDRIKQAMEEARPREFIWCVQMVYEPDGNEPRTPKKAAEIIGYPSEQFYRMYARGIDFIEQQYKKLYGGKKK